jgi:DNA polymerase III delta subunit
MLHVFFGNNPIQIRQAAYACAALYEEKGVKLSRIDTDTFVSGMLLEAAQSASLFGEKEVYLVDTPSSDAVFNAEVCGSLEDLHTSANIFIVIEESLLAAEKKTYTKFADSIDEIKEEKGAPFNVFALADSLLRKDKKMLWLGLCEARDAGLSSEEIIGTLWWQLKTLRLSAVTKNATEAGMKDFPYNKAKRSLSYFAPRELEALSHALLSVYHKGHQGEVDIEMALEAWTLSI